MSRWAQLVRLGYDSYAEYLASPHWQAVRRRYRESGRPLKCICGEPSYALHHETYERLGHEELDDLVPLCATCHTDIHVLERRGVSGLSVDALRDEDQAAVYAEDRRVLRERAADDRRALVADFEAARERSRRERERLKWHERLAELEAMPQRTVGLERELRVIRVRLKNECELGPAPLASMFEELQEAHSAGAIDASVCLAAVKRRIEAAELALLDARLRRRRTHSP